MVARIWVTWLLGVPTLVVALIVTWRRSSSARPTLTRTGGRGLHGTIGVGVTGVAVGVAVGGGAKTVVVAIAVLSDVARLNSRELTVAESSSVPAVVGRTLSPANGAP